MAARMEGYRVTGLPEISYLADLPGGRPAVLGSQDLPGHMDYGARFVPPGPTKEWKNSGQKRISISVSTHTHPSITLLSHPLLSSN